MKGRLALILSFAAALLIAPSAFAAVCTCNSCSGCMTNLSDSNCNEVRLTQNIQPVGSSNCIDSPANINNKIFDCAGFSMSNGINWGVHLYNKQSVEIRNCTITNFSYAIIISGASSSKINLTNNTMKYNGYGVQLSNIPSGVVLFKNNTMCSNSQSDLYSYSSVTGSLSGNQMKKLQGTGITADYTPCTRYCYDPDSIYQNSGIYWKGSINYTNGSVNFVNLQDSCLNMGYLNEWYCDQRTDIAKIAKTRCTGLCEDGACSYMYDVYFGHFNCTDTESATDYYTKGTVSFSNGSMTMTYPDYCLGSSMLTERFCTAISSISSIDYNCTYGCSDGACIRPPNTGNITTVISNATDTTENITINYNVTAKNSSIMLIALTPNVNATDTTLSVEEGINTSSLPLAPEGKVYVTVNLSFTSIGDDLGKNITNATINFSVSKNWLTSNAVEPITVKMYVREGGSWRQLPTIMLGSNADSYFYSALTTHMTEYMIGGGSEVTGAVSSPGFEPGMFAVLATLAAAGLLYTRKSH